MHKRTLILTIACIAAAFGVFTRVKNLNVPRDSPIKVLAERENDHQSAAKQHETSPPESHSSQQSESEKVAPSIEGELVFSFKTLEELKRFLKDLEDSGIRNHKSNRALLGVKVHDQDPAKLDKARALAEGRATTEYNYTVLTPYPVPPDSEYSGVAFENNALAHMGVPQGNSKWGEGTTIAILDTGVLEHPTLIDADIRHIDLIQDGEPFAPHGTAVASLIAGNSGNGLSPSSSLLSIRVLDSEGIGDTFTLAEGIVQAVDSGATIINMSLGGYGDSQVLRNAVDYASSRNVVLIAATGNEGLSVLPYPAQYDNVVSVAAVDANNTHASFSNHAANVDIAAPGVGVSAAWKEDQWVSFTGTSASAPYVSGAIAAILSERTGLSAPEAFSILQANANDSEYPGPDELTGVGIIDLQRSLTFGDSKVTDLALSSIYLDPIKTDDAQTRLFLSIQNRGTEEIPAANIVYTTGVNLPQTAYLGQLKPGEVKAHELLIHKGQLSSIEGLNIEAKAATVFGIIDDKPDNDQQVLLLINDTP